MPPAAACAEGDAAGFGNAQSEAYAKEAADAEDGADEWAEGEAVQDPKPEPAEAENEADAMD